VLPIYTGSRTRPAIEQQGHSENHKPPRAPLRDHLLTLDGLLNLPTVEPLIDGLIYCNTLTQLSGPPGCFKSFLAVGVSCCAAMGIDLGSFAVPKPRTVVYVVAEGAKRRYRSDPNRASR